MNTYLETRFRDAQRIFLDQVAYAARLTETWAEERGGFDALDEAARKSYLGRKNRLIQMAHYNDCAQELIESLLEIITEATSENSRLSAELRKTKGIDTEDHWRDRPLRSAMEQRQYVIALLSANPSRQPIPLHNLLLQKEARRRAAFENLSLESPHILESA